MPWHRRPQKDRYPCSKSVAAPTLVVKTRNWASTLNRKQQQPYLWVPTVVSLELNSSEKSYRGLRIKEVLNPCRVVVMSKHRTRTPRSRRDARPIWRGCVLKPQQKRRNLTITPGLTC